MRERHQLVPDRNTRSRSSGTGGHDGPESVSIGPTKLGRPLGTPFRWGAASGSRSTTGKPPILSIASGPGWAWNFQQFQWSRSPQSRSQQWELTMTRMSPRQGRRFLSRLQKPSADSLSPSGSVPPISKSPWRPDSTMSVVKPTRLPHHGTVSNPKSYRAAYA